MELLLKYFPELTERQREQFAALLPLYEDWNSKINVISRKDMANFYEHHVLHSLAIAKVQPFKTQADILDVGTGGGFPGIPLAIMFPHSNFYLIDSIGKKVKVVQNVVASLGLKNVRTEQIRAEQVQGEFDFIVSRAVTDLSQFTQWVRGKVSDIHYHHLRNGILYLKGGDLTEELAPFKKKVRTWDISDFFEEEFFQTKKVIYMPFK
ncbi:MAG: 16S rRNA (guanine(527)-N(7))-methyltransferase RsmG [Bacteroidales bacterium]|jgi:16S rRNA (guanine527-N7)-methyltransferase|nr:16S rRNA (guanine(527)-N(7))-methyltransferase RsmG [Bacteroidales bacterium]